MKTIINKLTQYILNWIDARIDKLVASEIQAKLDDIDIDRQVATANSEVNWSDHIDYSSLSYHIDIDHQELAKNIDTEDIADALTSRLHFGVTTQSITPSQL